MPLVACVARRVGGHEYGVRHLMRDVIDVQSACNQHALIMHSSCIQPGGTCGKYCGTCRRKAAPAPSLAVDGAALPADTAAAVTNGLAC